LSVIAGTRADDAACAIGRRHRGELVAGTAFLERARPLQILELEPERGAGGSRESLGMCARRQKDAAGDPRPCRFDVDEGDHFARSFLEDGVFRGRSYATGTTRRRRAAKASASATSPVLGQLEPEPVAATVHPPPAFVPVVFSSWTEAEGGAPASPLSVPGEVPVPVAEVVPTPAQESSAEEHQAGDPIHDFHVMRWPKVALGGESSRLD